MNNVTTKIIGFMFDEGDFITTSVQNPDNGPLIMMAIIIVVTLILLYSHYTDSKE